MQAALEAQKQNDLISTYEKQLENSRSQISMMEEQSSGARVECLGGAAGEKAPAEEGSEPSGEESQLLAAKMQRMEEQLMKNAVSIRSHQEQTDSNLLALLKELKESEEMPRVNRERIEEYLAQLERQIAVENDQHQLQIASLRDRIHNEQQTSREDDRLALLREIDALNSAVEVYHQESMRRKRQHRRVLETLLGDVSAMRGGEERLEELEGKMRAALEGEEEEELAQLELSSADFIISHNGVMQRANERECVSDYLMEEQAVQTDFVSIPKREVPFE